MVYRWKYLCDWIMMSRLFNALMVPEGEIIATGFG
jgi:hypothetical protein